MTTNETGTMDTTEIMRLQIAQGQRAYERITDDMERNTEELAVLRQEMVRIVEELEHVTDGCYIDDVARERDIDFSEAFEDVISERIAQLNRLKISLLGVMKIIMKNREALGLDCPVV